MADVEMDKETHGNRVFDRLIDAFVLLAASLSRPRPSASPMKYSCATFPCPDHMGNGSHHLPGDRGDVSVQRLRDERKGHVNVDFIVNALREKPPLSEAPRARPRSHLLRALAWEGATGLSTRSGTGELAGMILKVPKFIPSCSFLGHHAPLSGGPRRPSTRRELFRPAP